MLIGPNIRNRLIDRNFIQSVDLHIFCCTYDHKRLVETYIFTQLHEKNHDFKVVAIVKCGSNRDITFENCHKTPQFLRCSLQFSCLVTIAFKITAQYDAGVIPLANSFEE